MPSAKEKVAAELRKAILSRQMKEGEILSLDSVASQLNVSAMPVREAFQILARDGLIQLRKNKGAVVLGITETYIREHYQLRAILESAAAKLAAEQGNEHLHQMLQEVDPVSAKEIHANNVKRVIRALEFYHQNHSPISAHNQEQKEHETPYNLAYFVLNVPRELLYKRIDDRIDEMLDEGLLEEVQKLKDMGYHRGMVSMQGLGYKEILAYLDGEYPLEEAVRILKRDTRHFAKRQLTWFRREKDTIWMNKDEFDYNEELILEKMLEICKDKRIL